MKKFKWRLQRVLEIRIKQEDAVKAELMNLNKKIAEIGQEIISRKATRAGMLQDLGQIEASRRIMQQQAFYTMISVTDQMIVRLEKNKGQCEVQKQELVSKLARLQKFIKMLENLKQKARGQHEHELNVMEDKMLDEVAGIAIARELCGASH